MTTVQIAAIIVSLTALLAYVNARFLKLPSQIGLMAIALAASLVVVALNAAGVIDAREVEHVVAEANFGPVLLHGMLGLLLFAGSLNINLRELREHKWPVAVLSLGGTKIGLLAAEAVVVRNPELTPSLLYLRKQSMQLASKMRYVSAQLLALFEGDLWRRAAGHANAMAARLRAGLEGLPGVEPTQATQANAIFVRLPSALAAHLRERWHFYDWADGGEVRLMCAFDTTEAEVDEFVAAARGFAGV